MTRDGVTTPAGEAVIFHQANCRAETQTLRAYLAADRQFNVDLIITGKAGRHA